MDISSESENEVLDQVSEPENFSQGTSDKSVASRMIQDVQDLEQKVILVNEVKNKSERHRDVMQEKKIRLDTDWRDACEQLAIMESLVAKKKDTDLTSEEERTLDRKDAMVERKTTLQSQVVAAKKDLAAAKLADLEAGRAATSADEKLKEAKAYCKKFIRYAPSLSETNSSPHYMTSSLGAGSLPAPNLKLMTIPTAAAGMAPAPVTPVANTKKGISIPSFSANNRSFRKPEFIMKDLVDMVRFPACLEVSQF